MNETIETVGFVKVSLLVLKVTQFHLFTIHVSVGLEDVDIDGQVWLVTGTGFYGAQ